MNTEKEMVMSEMQFLSSDWIKYRLKDLVEIDPEQLSNSTDREYLFKYIDLSSVNHGNIEYPSNAIKFGVSPSRARKIIKDGDVIMSTVRPNLKGFAKFHQTDSNQYIASTGFAVLREKNISDIDFIYHMLFSDSIEIQINNLVVGSNYPAINTKSVKNLEILAPNKTIQHYIAQILTTCDKVIEQTEATIAKYKSIKQGMLHDLFTRGLDKNGKLRPAPSEAPDLYKESELGLIPKDWEVKRLEDIAVINSGIDYKKNHKGDTVPIYGTGGIMGYTSISLNQGPAVLSGRKGSINRPYYIDGEFWNVDTIFCIKTIENNNAKWLYYAIEQIDMMKYNEATGVPSITSKTLYRISFSTPLPQEQKEIINRIMPLEIKLQGEEKVLNKYKAIKKGLMEQLLKNN